MTVRSVLKCKSLLVFLTLLALVDFAAGNEQDLLSGHPRPAYKDVENIDAMAAALRKSLASSERYSFSRSWWKWDRLRCRYVDEGRTDENSLKILQAVFRGLILDWHRKLEKNGEGDLMYIFFTTRKGDKRERVLGVGNRTLLRDLHGGGYHGGWGGAARMRIYEELARQGMLTDEEKTRFRQIVHQSLERKFLDFTKGSQQADNHSFGNAGGVALALKLFPDAPQATEARAWIDRIWRHLAEFGDWTEWTYYPYGPIFLHGMLDVAEATGRIESDRDLVNAIGQRCLGFNHGGGVKGNPNAGSRVREDLKALYADPWNRGYYRVENSSRDGHFWYRLAQHYENSEYLWAAEQVALGGRPPSGKAPAEYQMAYNRRFAWFLERDITPKLPASQASIGLLSSQKHKIPERLYLNSGREPQKPFAAFFLFDKKDGHLDNITGHLYEYSVNGGKYLHTSGKYNNVYSGNQLKGGGTGEESLDLLLVLHKSHAFPLHPDRQGTPRDYMRMGSTKHLPQLLKAENNKSGDSFGQFGFKNHYGPESRWIRRAVLTAEGYLVVADSYVPGKTLNDDYLAGPVWHLGIDEQTTAGKQKKNWFDAPALDQTWWQKKKMRVVLHLHDDGKMNFGSLKQTHSQDGLPNMTTFGYRPVRSGKTERFLSVFVPHPVSKDPEAIAKTIRTSIIDTGTYAAVIGETRISIHSDGKWSVRRIAIDDR